MRPHHNVRSKVRRAAMTGYATAFAVRAVLAGVALLPALAMAQDEALTTTCGFLSSVLNLLNAASIVVVTIAVIFSGYQIAFAHKRITDVAPIMIGAILIGGASQIAKMFLTDSAGNDACEATASLWIPAVADLARSGMQAVQALALA